MKSSHRHELKTNELAEWLSNLPQWAKENRITIIGALVLIVIAFFSYFVPHYHPYQFDKMGKYEEYWFSEGMFYAFDVLVDGLTKKNPIPQSYDEFIQSGVSRFYANQEKEESP